MAESGILHCAHCGAPVEAGARHCDHCRAPIATVRCASCFAMNAPTALHCAGCGRELGLEPIPDPATFGCPACARELSSFRGAQGLLYDCGNCGGQFVEQALLHELLERREICGAAVPRRPLTRESAVSKVHYLPCPVCKALMNRVNFGGSSGVVVDVCAKNGVWFDSGELPRVLAFVETGGLARARRAQIEELERRERALRDESIQLAATSHATAEATERAKLDDARSTLGDTSGSLTYSSAPAWSTGLWDDAKEAAHQVLQQIGEEIARLRGPR
jgi:Zn-finger nucleic acid-binding protein